MTQASQPFPGLPLTAVAELANKGMGRDTPRGIPKDLGRGYLTLRQLSTNEAGLRYKQLANTVNARALSLYRVQVALQRTTGLLPQPLPEFERILLVGAEQDAAYVAGRLYQDADRKGTPVARQEALQHFGNIFPKIASQLGRDYSFESLGTLSNKLVEWAQPLVREAITVPYVTAEVSQLATEILGQAARNTPTEALSPVR